MQYILRTASAFVVTLAFPLILVGTGSFVQAQEADAEVIVEPSARTIAPLQLIKEKRLELQKKARLELEASKETLQNVRTEMRPDFKSASSSTERRTLIDEMRDKREGAREEQKGIRANLKERLQSLMRTHLGASIARLNAALRHFDKFAERIDSRIKKLKERGADTTSVEALLSDTVVLITSAKADVQSLTSLIDSIADTGDPQTVKSEIRASVIKATESTKAAHRALRNTTRELIALVKATVQTNSETDVDNGN
ncbi:MAG: hypothetical protein UY39_C0017G0005 [Candidatus Kaiserbacteria bacterium GW2011_GWC2_49_12]|nr:MAG: hypothetical protein UY39_C0017G0005 [Candidatus Kaiserbacteria bacterium GW2011_GWC2_49_12]KKW17685.1 MAG: hypothetical protein UY57_C0012G0005 [Candidatus Kaiserbacteria bacterium GW2011_GWB1_50_17]HCM43614.1 hypothetical protein [Candidatus Kaiserbacteria bacterium]